MVRRSSGWHQQRAHAVLAVVVVLISLQAHAAGGHTLSAERVVFQTKHGDLEFALYPKERSCTPQVAPVTTAHILKLAKMGAYNTIPFFRVDKGFVAQCTDVLGNRLVPLNARQQAEAEKKVPLEVRQDAKHSKRGILSMARWDDPNSGGASFSITLGPAPHLDMHYTVFGELTKGYETLDLFEKQPTKTEGIFVMPKEPIVIQSSYWYEPDDTGSSGACPQQLTALQERFDAVEKELHDVRHAQLPR